MRCPRFVHPHATSASMANVGRLDEVDLSLKLSRAESEQRLEVLGRRLLYLRLIVGGLVGGGGLGPGLAVVFEGWDASGKGGAIKRLVAWLDPRHVRVQVLCCPEREGETPSLSLALRPQPPRFGRDGGLRQVLVRTGAS